jgi:hypothetical protein
MPAARPSPPRGRHFGRDPVVWPHGFDVPALVDAAQSSTSQHVAAPRSASPSFCPTLPMHAIRMMGGEDG